jgi:hypothetical protein
MDDKEDVEPRTNEIKPERFKHGEFASSNFIILFVGLAMFVAVSTLAYLRFGKNNKTDPRAFLESRLGY